MAKMRTRIKTRIRKGDEVIVITGKDKSRRGTVESVVDHGKKVVVEGINTVKKNTKGNPNTGEKGGIIIKTMPLDISNVMIYNSVTEKGTRVGIKTLEDGRKVRFYKDNGELIDV